MTGPIEGSTGSGPIQPADEPEGAKPTERVGQALEVNAAGQTDETSGDVSCAQFDALRSIIQDGVDRGLGEDEILDEIVGSELKGAFGDSIARMTAKDVAEAVANDPNLSEMFARLIAMAKRK
jgi:hypothetical protein